MHNPFYHLESIFSLNSRYLDRWSIREPLQCYPDNCIIYVLDTGLDESHNEFQFSDIDVLTKSETDKNHATSLISLINGKTLGVSADSKVCFIDVQADEMFYDVLKKHREENKEKVGIILCAWQLPKLDDDLEKHIKDTFLYLLDNTNSILVTACGNKGYGNPLSFPATIDHPNNVVVGSHDPWGFISKFNNKTEDSHARIFAPGRKVLVADGNNQYKEATGSSYAAAIVTGCITYFSYDRKYNKILNKMYRNTNINKLCWKDIPEKTPNQSIFIGRKVFNTLYPNIIVLDDIGLLKCRNNEVFYQQSFNQESNNLKSILDDILFPIKNKNIVVPVSGGADSEWVTRVLSERDINFKAITMKYLYEDEVINQHDINDINWSFIKEHVYYDLNIKEFYEEGEFFNYMKKYRTNSPQLCTHLWLLDQLDKESFFIFAGEILYQKNNTWSRLPSQYYCYDYYKALNNRKGISRLLCYNTKITNYIVQKTQEKPFASDLIKYNKKIELFNRLGYNISKRHNDYTGFERLKEIYQSKHSCFRYFDSRFRDLL